MEEKKPKARREYKDTVFRMLFSDEKNLLSLYNEEPEHAVAGSVLYFSGISEVCE